MPLGFWSMRQRGLKNHPDWGLLEGFPRAHRPVPPLATPSGDQLLWTLKPQSTAVLLQKGGGGRVAAVSASAVPPANAHGPAPQPCTVISVKPPHAQAVSLPSYSRVLGSGARQVLQPASRLRTTSPAT